MFVSALGLKAEQQSPEHQLWSAVILNAVQEWLSGSLRLSQQAEQYLFHDEKDFPMVCRSAGMDPGRLRGQLGRMTKNGPRPVDPAPRARLNAPAGPGYLDPRLSAEEVR